MKLNHYIYSLLASVLMLLAACTPDEYELGGTGLTKDDLAEGIAYTITHDSENPNIVYLESKMGSGYMPLWEHPLGRSQESKVTLRMPFEGTYSVTFGVETRGGVLYGDPVTFTINDFCAEFVTDELWTMLTGGVGSSKVWIYDNGEYGYGSGEISYGDPDANTGFGWNSFTANWDPGAGHCGDSDMWNSTMTFDLIGAANYSFYNSTDGTTQTGLFSMDTDAHTIAFTDADLMHPTAWDGRKSNWRSDFKIIELDENHLRIGYERIPGDWGGKWLEVFNYVSKEYADNYVPEVPDVYPTLAEDWRDYVEPKTNKVITYKLSDTTPFDWCNRDGSTKGITAVTALSGVEEVTLVLNSGTGEYSVTDIEGNEYTGKYTLDDNGIYTFDSAFPEIALSADGRAMLRTNSDQTLRILSFETSDYSGGLTDLWLGSEERDDQGNLYQYMGYHFVVQTGSTTVNYKATLNFFDTGWAFINGDAVFISGSGDYTLTVNGASSAPYGMYLDVEKILKDNPNVDIVVKDIKVDGASIEFDDTLIDRGVGDADTTARRYILNPWGATAGDASKYVFSSSIAVTISVVMDNGTPFIPEAEE